MYFCHLFVLLQNNYCNYHWTLTSASIIIVIWEHFHTYSEQSFAWNFYDIYLPTFIYQRYFVDVNYSSNCMFNVFYSNYNCLVPPVTINMSFHVYIHLKYSSLEYVHNNYTFIIQIQHHQGIDVHIDCVKPSNFLYVMFC